MNATNKPFKPLPLQLFRKSILKQAKWHAIEQLIDSPPGKVCLDVGADNGVISYLLRQQGGIWHSIDSAQEAVESIKLLVKERVYQITPPQLPFPDNMFDQIVIIDILEHMHDDAGFIKEIFRVLKPGGTLILNAPHIQYASLLRRFRYCLGLTDEKHGHIRPGYTRDQMKALLPEDATVVTTRTYSRICAELIDTAITWSFQLISKKKGSAKGVLVTQQDLSKRSTAFKCYALIYPLVWLITRLDYLFFFMDGYNLIMKVTYRK